MKISKFANEAEWLAARRGSIGGSDAPIVAGVSPYVSPLQLYYEKAGLLALDLGDPEPREWGKRLEPLVAEVYARDTGRQLIDHGINMFIGEFGFPSHASLDREIVDAKRGPGVLQVKTSTKYSLKELQEEIPLDWQVQIQHEMANAGMQWGSFAILMFPSRKLGWIDVDRNEPFIKSLLAKEADFWRMVEARTPPEADGSASATATIRALYPKDSGVEVKLPEAAIKWDDELQDLKATVKAVESDIAELENKIKAAIGENSRGVLPGGIGSYTWKRQQRAGYTVEPTEFRVLRRAK